MYSIKVRGGKPAAQVPAQQNEEPTCSGSTPGKHGEASSSSADATPAAVAAEEVDEVSFSAGNPRVEHITGVMHLYRHIPADEQPQQQQQGDGGGWASQSNRRTFRQAAGGSDLPPAQGDSSPAAAAASTPSSPFAPLAFPAGRNEQLCILALPADMGFAELCTFLGGYFPKVRELRLVRREGGKASLCSVLVRFDEQAAADDFYTNFNGKPFCLLEPEIICRLVFVKDVEYQSGESDQAFRAPQGTTELPTCPVCLERLDEHISGIVTTWGDTSCPVCRYCQHSSAATTSHCNVCSTTADLWICLICGHVGCGRYRGLHAAAHWQESGHGYALELETQRVWDYVNDSYVHRLIQSKTDGKLVEVPSPALTSSGQQPCYSRPHSRGPGGHRHHSGAGLSSKSECGEDPEYDEALMLSKLDALATEYNHLLVTQLESQRQFFEGQLVKQRQELDAEAGVLSKRMSQAEEAVAVARAAAEENERRRRQAESKLADTNNRLQAAQRERDFLKQLNDTLLANQKDYQARLAAVQVQLDAMKGERDATVQDLTDQVRDLMVFIEARDKIEKVGGSVAAEGELAGGTVLPLPSLPQQAQHQGRGGSGRGSRRRR
ncbi:hypothetical protein N2152v2_005344 [Parachlorella kessleri]